MNSRHWMVGLAILLSLVCIGLANRAATFAQDGVHIYLPLITKGKQQSSGQPTSTATPPAVNNPWAPPPTATATATSQRTYPAWVPGTYNIRTQKLEGWGEYHADGAFAEQYSTFGVPGIQKATGQWFVTDGELVVEFTNQAGQAFRRHFLIEEIAGEGFRIAAGDAKLTAYLYERMTPVKAVDGQYVSQWVRGRWDSIFRAFLFHEDGSYEFYETSPFGELKTLLEEGQWSAAADRMVIQPEGEILANSTYTITSATVDYLKIVNGNNAEWSLFRKTWYPPTSMNEFDGQYIAGNMTLTVEKVTDTNYAATLLINGVLTQATGVVDEYGRLVLTKANGESYPPLQRHFNALVQDDFLLPSWITKVSETVLPTQDNTHGLWVDGESSTNSELWLLPDGRYVESSSFHNTKGTYVIQGDTIMQDPFCAAPYTRTVTFVGNQMLLSTSNETSVFHYVPRKLPDLMAQMAAWDDAEALASEAFAKRTPLEGIDQTYITPVDGEVLVDPNRNNIYANAVGFDEAQLYYWFDSVTYYLDTRGGALVGIHPITCAISDICNTLDFSRYWKNKFHYRFYPNGRYLIYFETYHDAVSTMPVTPTIRRWWGKYKIQDEVILTESDTGELFARKLLRGRRQALQGETCLDNIAQ